jgi:hypothetical protein
MLWSSAAQQRPEADADLAALDPRCSGLVRWADAVLRMYRSQLVGLSLALLSCSVVHRQLTGTPKSGFVPDEKTAIRIAEAVVGATYGEETMADERPFRAKLAKDVWTVVGSFHCPCERPARSDGPGDTASSNEECLCVGGVASAKISRRDGTMLELYHTQ